MSIERCEIHDETYDSDFVECCPDCERSGSWDADVELAESMFSTPEPTWNDQRFMDDKLLEVQS